MAIVNSNSSALYARNIHMQTLRCFPREVQNIKHDRYSPQGLERSNPRENYPHTRETWWASCHARRLAQHVSLACGKLKIMFYNSLFCKELLFIYCQHDAHCTTSLYKLLFYFSLIKFYYIQKKLKNSNMQKEEWKRTKTTMLKKTTKTLKQLIKRIKKELIKETKFYMHPKRHEVGRDHKIRFYFYSPPYNNT